MAGSVNVVTIVGRVGKDPDLRKMPNGDAVANISVATSETWKDRESGERKEKTEWHKCSIMNPALAKIVGDYVKKGSLIYVSGSLQTRKWQDQSGQDKFSTEIVVGRFKGDIQILEGRKEDSAPKNDGGSSYADDIDDNVPF